MVWAPDLSGWRLSAFLLPTFHPCNDVQLGLCIRSRTDEVIFPDLKHVNLMVPSALSSQPLDDLRLYT